MGCTTPTWRHRFVIRISKTHIIFVQGEVLKSIMNPHFVFVKPKTKNVPPSLAYETINFLV